MRAGHATILAHRTDLSGVCGLSLRRRLSWEAAADVRRPHNKQRAFQGRALTAKNENRFSGLAKSGRQRYQSGAT